MASSPLTSLSSLDETGEEFQSSSSKEPVSLEDLRTAQLLCDLRNLVPVKGKTSAGPRSATVTEKVMADMGTQTDLEPQTFLSMPAEPKEMTKSVASKRKAPSRSSLRNTSEVTLSDAALRPQASTDFSSPAKPKRARITTKLEREEPASIESELSTTPQAQKPGRGGRGRRKPRQGPGRPRGRGSTSGARRAPASTMLSDPPIPVVSEPAPPPPALPSPVIQPSKPVTPKASVTITQSGTSSTPTLKIRLPRLSAVTATHSNSTFPVLQSPPSTHSPVPDTAMSHESRPRRSSRRQDSASASVSGASSYTAEVVEDSDSAKPRYKPRGRKHIEST